jgi:hypothetical protein
MPKIRHAINLDAFHADAETRTDPDGKFDFSNFVSATDCNLIKQLYT